MLSWDKMKHMNVVLSSQTQKLLEKKMKETDGASPDDVILAALQTLEREAFEDLDAQTRAAIERAEARADRGEGIPLDEAFVRLRSKHFGN